MIFWALVGYLFLFIFRPYEYWPILGTFRIERVYMIILMVLVFFNKDNRYISHAVNRVVILFFFVIMLAGITALHVDVAFDGVFEYFKLLIFYFIVISSLRDEKELKNFIFAYLMIMMLYVEKSCWEYFFNDRNSYQQGMARLVGIDTFYGDSNSFAASIVYSLPFLLALFRYRLDLLWQRLLLWVYAAMIPVAIIYTGSRSGMVACLFFLFLLWMSSSHKILTLVSLAVALATSWNFMPQKLQDRFLSIFIQDIGPDAASASVSAQGRIDGFWQGVKIFQENPLFGVGPYNFKFSWDAGMQAHNLYGQVLGDLGGIGTLVFMVLVGTIYRVHKKIISRIRNFRTKAPEAYLEHARSLTLFEYLSVASIQTILILLFNGLFGHNLYRYNWLWLGAIGVLSTYLISRYLDNSENTGSSQFESPFWK